MTYDSLKIHCRRCALANDQARKIQKPSARDFKSLEEWLISDDGGDNFLIAPEHTIWKYGLPEYISLTDFEQRDVFSDMMYGSILSVYHKLWGKRKQVITK